MTDDAQKLDIPDKGMRPGASAVPPEANAACLLNLTNPGPAEVNVLQILLAGNAASEILDTVDQALLSGLQLADELEAEFCTPAYLQKGVKYPTECEVQTHT